MNDKAWARRQGIRQERMLKSGKCILCGLPDVEHADTAIDHKPVYEEVSK